MGTIWSNLFPVQTNFQLIVLRVQRRTSDTPCSEDDWMRSQYGGDDWIGLAILGDMLPYGGGKQVPLAVWLDDRMLLYLYPLVILSTRQFR